MAKQSENRSQLPVLPQVAINSPCPKDWHQMDGDAARRFCGHCQKHVHNFSEMTAGEVDAVLASDQKVCARIIRNSDGSIVTKSPGETRRRWIERLAAMVAGFIATFAISGCHEDRRHELGDAVPYNPPVSNEMIGKVRQEPIEQREVGMGGIGGFEMGGAQANPETLVRMGEAVAPKQDPKSK